MPEPRLGATWDGRATSVSVRSPGADRVELCVRAAGEGGAEWRTDMTREVDGTWSAHSDRLRPRDQYGFRVHGAGVDPRWLLLDPAALAVRGELDWTHLDFAAGGEDTGPFVPWSVVVDPTFDWQDDARPVVAAGERVVYELNVRSFTRRLASVPAPLRGTYLALAQPPVLEHLQRLGVTTLELLPVQQFVTGRAQWARGQRNLWGYDPVAWRAPHGAYATRDDGTQVQELQETIRALHGIGIEVVLDVVFNHTGEYDRTGPAVCYRGLDDDGWYRHHGDGTYEDTTGCRNTVDLRPAANRAFVVESLRSWVEVFHVDGFRFDLATTLLRGDDGVDAAAPFLADVAADPVLADRLMIAEPWDAAGDGYRLGGFPPPWAEWNDRFRDDIRDVWRTAPGTRERLATRLAGSSDVFAASGRRPSASLNFVTAHDGFTLADLVSYDQRHNEANGEGGNDGASDNRSWNCGVEGPTDDPVIRALRSRQQRNLLATLLLAHGTPMLVAGDELGRTQGGNNNPYCQDNEVSWLDWDEADEDLCAFTASALSLRRSRPELQADAWLTPDDVTWRTADGRVLTDHDWWSWDDHLLVMAYRSLVVVLNPTPDDRAVVLPDEGPWSVLLDTATTDPASRPANEGATFRVAYRSVAVLARP